MPKRKYKKKQQEQPPFNPDSLDYTTLDWDIVKPYVEKLDDQLDAEDEIRNPEHAAFKKKYMLYWILDKDHNQVPARLLTWGAFFQNKNNCRVAETTLGHLWVSTVFIGIDHGMMEADAPPVLFESMIF